MKLRKILIIIFAAMCTVAVALCLTSCLNGNNSSAPCQHQFGAWEDVVNTCTEHTQRRTCKLCNRSETQYVPTIGHRYRVIEDITNTCTEHTQKVECIVCNYETVQSVTPKGHKFGIWQDEVYTCTEHTQKRTCSVCQYKDTRSEELKPHSYGEWNYISNDCFETEQKRYCSMCNDFETRTEEARGHSYTTLQEVDTCTVHTQEQKCSRCGDEITITLKPRGHNYASGKCEDCQTLFYDGDTGVLDIYNSTYGYEYFVSTSPAQAELYERIDEQVRAFHLNSEINAEKKGGDYVVADIAYDDLGLEAEKAVAVWVTYKNDNPLYYWLSYSLQYTVESLRLLTVDEYAQGSARAEANDFVYNKVTEFSNLTQYGDNAYRLALAFHDAIIGEIDYAYNNSGKPETAAWAHSVMGVFTGRGGVCESYAKTFQLLLNYNGVENILVTGQGSNEAHEWNLVRLDDGNWYWCDLTWDDTPKWEWGVSYYYFLVNDTQNVNWRDVGWVVTEHDFLYNHTPYTTQGALTEYLYPLPERAVKPYSESGLTLRKTFTVGKMTYAVAGYNAVQLTNSTAKGAVNIPETVTFEDVTYTVISIGGIDDKGHFCTGSYFASETTSLTIPKTVKFIWDLGVSISQNKSITVDSANEWFCSVDGVLFTKSMITLVQYPSARTAAEYRIPDGCVQIAAGAFNNSSEKYLTRLYIGADLRMVGMLCWGTYYDNSRNISGGIKNVVGILALGGRIIIDSDNPYFSADDKAIYNADRTYLRAVFDQDTITSFEIPASVTYMDDRIFDDCTKLQSFTVEEGNTEFAALGGILYNSDYTLIRAVPEALSGAVVLSDSLIRIGNGPSLEISDCFYGRNITSVSFGTSVKEICRSAFSYCTYLAKINFGGTVEEWLAIEKGENWCGWDGAWAQPGNVKIYCTDGVVDKFDKVIG